MYINGIISIVRSDKNYNIKKNHETMKKIILSLTLVFALLVLPVNAHAQQKTIKSEKTPDELGYN
jgi:hypothetical protein